LSLADHAVVSINSSRPPPAGGNYNIDYAAAGGVAIRFFMFTNISHI